MAGYNKYRGKSVSIIGNAELLLFERINKKETLQDVLDPMIDQDNKNRIKALVIGLPACVLFIYLISRFIFIPLLLLF